MRGLLFIVSLGASNFLFQALRDQPDYWLAADRAWFQVTAILFFVWFMGATWVRT